MDDKTYRSEALSPPCCIEWYSWVSRRSAPSYTHDPQPQRGTCFLCHLNVCSNGHDLGVGGTVKKLFCQPWYKFTLYNTYIYQNKYTYLYIYVWQLILSAQTAPSWNHAYYAWKINMTDRSRTKISTSALKSCTPAAPCTRRCNHMHKNDNSCRKPRQSKVKPEQPGHSHCQFSKAPAHHWIICPSAPLIDCIDKQVCNVYIYVYIHIYIEIYTSPNKRNHSYFMHHQLWDRSCGCKAPLLEVLPLCPLPAQKKPCRPAQ